MNVLQEQQKLLEKLVLDFKSISILLDKSIKKNSNQIKELKCLEDAGKKLIAI